MPVNNDSSRSAFLPPEFRYASCPEFQNCLCGLLLRDSFRKVIHIHARGILLAQPRRELHLAVDGIIVRDKPANESDHDSGRLGGSVRSQEQDRSN